MVTPERWKQISQLYEAALERQSDERAAFLAQACGEDHVLFQEVESLLVADGRADGFLVAGVMQDMAKLVMGHKPESLIGQQLDHYQVLALLGMGGMGEVYHARDLRLERDVAIKLLPRTFNIDPQRLRRFEQESRATSALNHPNILTVHDFGLQEGAPFIVMELLEGKELRAYLRNGPLPIRKAITYGQQIAAGLAAAHEKGIVHRDLKPENLFVTKDDHLKILDFGLATLCPPGNAPISSAVATQNQLTQPGAVMGTPQYMSPEQARGEKADARTDIFSLGIVLYEMLTGHPPFAGANAIDVMSSILRTEPAPLKSLLADVPEVIMRELERIVSKALRKDREQRYQTSKDLLIDLNDLKEEIAFTAKMERSVPTEPKESVEAIITTTEKTTTLPTTSSTKIIFSEVSRHKLGVGLAVVVIMIAAFGLFFWFKRPAPLTDRDTILLADFVNTTGDAAFDGTLKQALAVQLEQSPFLRILSEEQVREVLSYMGRTPDERVTREVAREICQRQGFKAMLVNSIARFDHNYAITLEVVNVKTGEAIARQQVEAEGKDQVLKALGGAATKLREKLGESLASIQKFDAPLELATTSSFEALKTYSQGAGRNSLEALPLCQRAVELDPNFALAWSALASIYGALGKEELAAQAARKAYELRERVSDNERFSISWRYHRYVTGNVAEQLKGLELWKRAYPRSVSPRILLTSYYATFGQDEKAIVEAREALSLKPNSASAYRLLAGTFSRLNRFDEARAICQQALQLKLDDPSIHTQLYRAAFVLGDTATMKQQIEWMIGKPNETSSFEQSFTAAFSGRLRQANEFSARYTEFMLRHNLEEKAGEQLSLQAEWLASVGNCSQAREEIARARPYQRLPFTFWRLSLAHVLCGDVGQARLLTDEMVRKYPEDSYVMIYALLLRAALELQRGRPDSAVQSLQAARRYENSSYFYQNYLLGRAYLAQRKGAEAAAEFQKILDHRGWMSTSALYIPAHLWLARAAMLQGDRAKARKEYQDFLALWKDADADLPILIEAKKEYEELK